MSAALAYTSGVRPALVQSLRERIDLLEEENRQLREAMEASVAFPAGWRLTKSEDRLLAALMRAGGGYLSKERLLTLLYGLEPDVEIKIIDVFVCKLRRKLLQTGSGVQIRTLHGSGYGLSSESRARLREALQAGTDDGRYRLSQAEQDALVADLKVQVATLAERVATLEAEADVLRSERSPAPSPSSRSMTRACGRARAL